MIKIGIVGYGNLGRGVECAIRQNPDMELCAVFTRRKPETLKILTPNVPVVHMDDILSWKEKLDVLILCGGSATDLPVQTPALAKDFCVIDSFDTHAKIPSISPPWMPPPGRAAKSPLFPWAGTRVCSP